jgi:hypothetical protein
VIILPKLLMSRPEKPNQANTAEPAGDSEYENN